MITVADLLCLVIKAISYKHFNFTSYSKVFTRVNGLYKFLPLLLVFDKHLTITLGKEVEVSALLPLLDDKLLW